MLGALSREVEQRSDQLGVLEALLVSSSASRKFLPSLLPIEDGEVQTVLEKEFGRFQVPRF